jgi:nitrogen fixation NifU-like protein
MQNDPLGDLYSEMILDHYKHPHNFGVLDPSDISYEDDNPLCGDHLRMDIRLDDQDRVSDVRFSGQGCAVSVASASMLTDEIKGKTLDELRHFDRERILEMLGLPLSPMRLKCALLPLKVLKAGAYGLTAWPGEEE